MKDCFSLAVDLMAHIARGLRSANQVLAFKQALACADNAPHGADFNWFSPCEEYCCYFDAKSEVNYTMAKRKESYKKKESEFKGNRYTKVSKKQKKKKKKTVAESGHVNNESNDAAVEATFDEVTETAPSTKKSTASGTKLEHVREEIGFDYDDELTGFRFVDCELLVQFVTSLLCPECKQPRGASRLSSTSEERTDLASKFTFECGCHKKVTFLTSKKCNKVFEVNRTRRFPLSIFAIGRHQTHGKKFLGNMNIPSSLYIEQYHMDKPQETDQEGNRVCCK